MNFLHHAVGLSPDVGVNGPYTMFAVSMSAANPVPIVPSAT